MPRKYYAPLATSASRPPLGGLAALASGFSQGFQSGNQRRDKDEADRLDKAVKFQEFQQKQSQEALIKQAMVDAANWRNQNTVDGANQRATQGNDTRQNIADGNLGLGYDRLAATQGHWDDQNQFQYDQLDSNMDAKALQDESVRRGQDYNLRLGQERNRISGKRLSTELLLGNQRNKTTLQGLKWNHQDRQDGFGTQILLGGQRDATTRRGQDMGYDRTVYATDHADTRAATRGQQTLKTTFDAANGKYRKEKALALDKVTSLTKGTYLKNVVGELVPNEPGHPEKGYQMTPPLVVLGPDGKPDAAQSNPDALKQYNTLKQQYDQTNQEQYNYNHKAPSRGAMQLEGQPGSTRPRLACADAVCRMATADGLPLPRTSSAGSMEAQMSRYGWVQLPKGSLPRPKDIVFEKGSGPSGRHVQYSIGGGKVLHSPGGSLGNKVVEGRVNMTDQTKTLWRYTGKK